MADPLEISGSAGIVALIMLGLVLAAVMRARAVTKLKPVIEAAARKHGGEVHQSFLGMPRITKRHRGHVLRLTPMIASTASPDGGSTMTCVDFEWVAPAVGEFRVREKSKALRNKIPEALMGGSDTFMLGNSRLDDRFIAVGTNVAGALRVLRQPSISEGIASLPEGADIQVRSGRCMLAVKGFPASVEEIDRLFMLGEQLLDALMDTSRAPSP